jgi:predicted acetyltransferase
VLVLCNEENVASARAIERCGGRFESRVTDPEANESLRRYWIR